MRTELHALVDNALAWCGESLPFFSITRTQDVRVSGKAFAELVLALNVLRDAGYPRTPAYDALTALAVDEVQAFDWEAAIAYRADTLLFAGYLNTFCAENGIPSVIPTDRIMATLDDVLPLDLVPYRELDLLCACERSGSAISDERFIATLMRSGCTGDGAVGLDDLELYAATHAFFYVTAFGARRRLPSAVAEAAVAAVRLGLDVTLRERNADLVGEFLMCCAALGVPAGERERQAWRFLTGAQQADGAVPLAPAAGVPAGDARARWRACYHTTLVTAMAAAMRLAHAD